jgi:hypothetical protein
MNQQPQQLPIVQNNFRYFKDKKPTYKPVEDGFITTSGNPSLGMKYGNTNSNNYSINNSHEAK